MCVCVYLVFAFHWKVLSGHCLFLTLLLHSVMYNTPPALQASDATKDAPDMMNELQTLHAHDKVRL